MGVASLGSIQFLSSVSLPLPPVHHTGLKEKVKTCTKNRIIYLCLHYLLPPNTTACLRLARSDTATSVREKKKGSTLADLAHSQSRLSQAWIQAGGCHTLNFKDQPSLPHNSPRHPYRLPFFTRGLRPVLEL